MGCGINREPAPALFLALALPCQKEVILWGDEKSKNK